MNVNERGSGVLRLAAAAVLSALAACGGGGGGGSTPSSTVGGSISGLLSSGLVLSNGSSTLSPAAGATSFTFATALASGTAYTVSIQTQPAGLTCTVSSGSGTIGSSPVTNVAVVCPTPWLFQAGSRTAKAAGVYGSEGSAAAANTPGARDGGASWTDASGNLWLFGGYGYDSAGTLGYLSDLWKFTPSTGEWTWAGGSELQGTAGTYGSLGVASGANAPGARQGAAAWKDAAGNFWLFGGYQANSAIPTGFLNDLWKYSPSTGLWTWVGGSNSVNVVGVYGTEGVAASGNIPGARAGTATWVDTAGDLWLFGGSEFDVASGTNDGLNDLWKYSPTTNQWTWVGGSQTVNANGVYGSVGAPAASTIPGARDGAVAWVDAGGNLWLFGGKGYDSASTTAQDLNDLWKFSPASGEWTWESGSKTNSAVGVYGTLGTAAGANVPGARNGASGWTDASGNLWLIGGSGYDALGNGGALNDVWEFSPSSVQWTWITGSSSQGAAGAYTTVDTPGAIFPGGRAGASTWADGQGHFWLFGGIGLDSVATLADLNDLWEYKP